MTRIVTHLLINISTLFLIMSVISDLLEPSSLFPHPTPISSIKLSEEEVYEALAQVDPNKPTGILLW